MARGKKGRPISGWLVVDKPAGVTSTSVVGKVRWALDAKKAGHAGTLDPAATGVLAIALGEATKTVPFVTDAMKGYRFCVRWGAATDTDDAEGQV
ncbi:MAG: tRNA pseudouridine(55) synthase TruB, partial [Rhodobacteraceae bacterium]|nr:tRNA pseudouridine(55) synthase TruB [Paracoccaceae bacterium]